MKGFNWTLECDINFYLDLRMRFCLLEKYLLLLVLDLTTGNVLRNPENVTVALSPARNLKYHREKAHLSMAPLLRSYVEGKLVVLYNIWWMILISMRVARF